MQSNETKLPERHELLNDDIFNENWYVRFHDQKKKINKKKKKEEKSNCGSALNQSYFDRSNSDRDAPRSGKRGILG